MLKRIICMAVLVGCSVGSHAQESLMKNGGFEDGSKGWKGKENIVSEHDTNRICSIEVERKRVEFFQDVNGRGYKEVTLSYKIKASEDYEGTGYEIGFSNGNGTYFYYTLEPPQASEGWVDRKITFSPKEKLARIKVSFIVKEGEQGILSFDDIFLVGLASE